MEENLNELNDDFVKPHKNDDNDDEDDDDDDHKKERPQKHWVDEVTR